MNILLTAATRQEIEPLFRELETQQFRLGAHSIQPHISGVGSMSTVFSLLREIHRQRPAFIIQGGIAGSFRESLPAPQVVAVQKETLADLGAWENGRFSDIFDLGLHPASEFPYRDKWLVNPLMERGAGALGLAAVTGITINEISTHPDQIREIREKYEPDLESMEGAALHYIALMEGIPFLQVRAISNSVGDRNKQNWKMREAIEALNAEITRLIPKLG